MKSKLRRIAYILGALALLLLLSYVFFTWGNLQA